MHSVDWSAFSAADVLAFADTVIQVARNLARIAPAARGAPLFGLDMGVGDPELLDRFSRHGIFRKYQRALALGAGLGGVQRWWSVHFGCSVLSVDPHPGLVDASARLGAAAGIAERVTFRSAPLHNLPMRGEQFTHVWSVDDLDAHPELATVLREALRVLRPAGLLTVTLHGAASGDPIVGRWTHAVTEAGFGALAVKRLPLPEVPYAVYFAEHVLRAALNERFAGEQRDRLLALAAAHAAARARRVPRVLLFAERPS